MLFALLCAVTTIAGTAAESPNSSVGCRVKYGIIDTRGKIRFILDDGAIGEFSEGLAPVVYSDSPRKPYAFIDGNGKIQFTIACDWPPGSFHDGRALIHRSSGYGYIDTNGKEVIACKYKDAESFSSGMAEVVLPGAEWVRVAIDADGNTVAKLPAAKSVDRFFPYSAVVKDSRGLLTFISSGFEINHTRLSHYSEGLAWVSFRNDRDECVVGYMDKSKHILIVLAPEIEQAGDFHEGLAPVIFKYSGSNSDIFTEVKRLGFIDKSGKVVIEPTFADLHVDSVRFSDGIAMGHVNGYATYIDRSGRVVGRFISGTDFHNGLASVAVLVGVNGNIVKADDNTYGYQSNSAWQDAWFKLLKARLCRFCSAHPIDFQLFLNDADSVKVSIYKSSGDGAIDKEFVSEIMAVPPPARCAALKTEVEFVPLQFRNGNLYFSEYRMRRNSKTMPTLPEGAPVPDEE